ncbi:putative repeat protein (TIGR01451 family) [Allocatelliglobosispora scoriae]|uniref:Putative repeat protein (TIGR01451 family) n=1 Tax=Allocatelliglobosispora scoriae TaxID=643052 RepID=A0A841BRE8_9ACTN|nr:DUF11 domain-containing protein [Allocatelliglobosispora scoriae]MBB5869956.1 putative repeat protein (TIGR01451 family) [Allocatelliglobosispora scoriae]
MIHRRRVLAAVSALTAAFTSLLAGVPAVAAERAFTLRYSHNAWGNVEQAGNTLMTCPPGPACDAAHTGTANNNGFAMQWVDVDGDPSTFNSSSARIQVPPGAEIDWVGLYWGGDTGTPNSSGRAGCVDLTSTGKVTLPPDRTKANIARVKVGTAAYVDVTADSFDLVPSSIGGDGFQGFAEITELFAPYEAPAALTSVDITVADVQLARGLNCGGGWSAVLSYEYPVGPDPLVSPNPTYAPDYRNISIFDGFTLINGTTSRSVTLSGFETASTGPVDAWVGVVGYEGDRSTTGDKLLLNDVAIATNAGSANNFFDSAIRGKTYAVPSATLPGVGQVDPVFENNLGVDAEAVPVPAAIVPNSATSVKATFTTNGDTYYPGAFIFTARIVPRHNFVKSVQRADGSDGEFDPVGSGEKLTMTLTLKAIGDQPLSGAVVTDPVPAGFTPVPNSSTVDGAPQTDAGDGDKATLTGKNYRWTLGDVPDGNTVIIKFQVIVNPTAPTGEPIVNRADLAYQIGGNTFTGQSRTEVTPGPVDVAIAKTAAPVVVHVNGETTFTLTVTNTGKGTATGIVVTDKLPAGLSPLENTPSQGTYAKATGVWTVGTLAEGATATLTMQARVDALGGTGNTARITATDQTDADPGNDTATASVTGINAALVTDLTITETDPAPPQQQGDTITITLDPGNNGPTDATDVRVVDTPPAGWVPVSATGAGWTCTVKPKQLECLTQRIPAGQQGEPITITLRIPADAPAGTAVNRAVVSSGVDESDPDNNTAAGSFTLPELPPPPPSPSGSAGPDMPDTGQPNVPLIALGGAAALVAGALLITVTAIRLPGRSR